MHGSVSVMYTQSRNFIIKQFTKYKSYCIKLVCTFNYYKFGNILSGSKIGCFARDNLTYKRFRADLNSRREAYILRYNNINLPKQYGKNPVSSLSRREFRLYLSFCLLVPKLHRSWNMLNSIDDINVAYLAPSVSFFAIRAREQVRR